MRPMPNLELEYVCKKCGSAYPATVSYSGRVEDFNPDDSRSRCPFCGEWNCADPRSVERAAREDG